MVKVNAKSYRLWLSYTDFEMCVSATATRTLGLTRLHSQRLNYAKARTLFRNAVNKALDWPEAVWEAWIQFEDFYGTVESLETAKTRVTYLEEARQKKQMKVGRLCGLPRSALIMMWQEYQQQQAQAASRPTDTPAAATSVATDPNARIDELAPAAEEDTKKRKPEEGDTGSVDSGPASKRVRVEEPIAAVEAEGSKDLPTLKRCDLMHRLMLKAMLTRRSAGIASTLQSLFPG